MLHSVRPRSRLTIMSRPKFSFRLSAWFRARRPLRWVESIMTDYSDWQPL